MKRTLLLVAGLALAAPAWATDYSAAMSDYLQTSIRSWAESPVLVDAIVAQNAASQSLTQADIDAMDKTWRGEVGTGSTPTITPILNNPAAEFLRQQVAASGGAITEAFIMDDKGMLVAASNVTSDYWQGDEDKWQQTYSKGPDAVHISEVELDESSQHYQAQVSIPIVDGTGAVVGALTVGIDADAL